MTPVDQALLQPQRCALLVVDMQNDYCHPDGALGAAGLDLSGVTAMCPVVNRLRKGAAGAGVLNVVVRTTHSPTTDSPAWSRRGSVSNSLCQVGTWGAGAFGVEATDEDLIITKHRYSAFVGTELDLVLRASGRSTVVVVGTATNVCVESTVRDACMRDYDTVVVADAVTTSDATAHTASLDNVAAFFGTVVSAAFLLRVWREARRPGDN